MDTKESQDKLSENNPNKVGHSLVEFLVVLAKYRWFLFLFIFIISVGATTYALLATKWYKATASVLPAERASVLGSFSGLSSLVKSFSPTKGIAALTGTSEVDRYMAILKSGTMINDVISKFKIREEYEMEDAYYEKVVKAFFSNLEIDVEDEGNLVVSVYDMDPQKAADIANYMIMQLNEVNTRLSVTNAKANREFIERRYIESITYIDTLENAMKNFQEKYGVIAVPEQLEATVKAMSDIYAQLAQKEVELSVMRRTYGEDSPLTLQADIGVQELNKKINSLNAGNDLSNDGVNLLIPFKKAPGLGYKYFKIYKDLEIQYKILEFVQPMYEEAKVEEVRNTPSVLVLDYAGPAERKAKPKGSVYLVISFLSSTFIGLLIVFTLEGINKIKMHSPEKFAYIRNSFSLKSKKQKRSDSI
jgi:capsule polysaccharide export protein KpsE/RkpR